jgi:hypothetical protein
MNNELELKLVEKYPKIYSQYGGDMKETCMHWGFEHRDQWYDLINVLSAKIQNYIDWKERNNTPIPQVVAEQVKEKFGTLRFYYRGGDDFIDGLVSMAEGISGFIK